MPRIYKPVRPPEKRLSENKAAHPVKETKAPKAPEVTKATDGEKEEGSGK